LVSEVVFDFSDLSYLHSLEIKFQLLQRTERRVDNGLDLAIKFDLLFRRRKQVEPGTTNKYSQPENMQILKELQILVDT